MLGQAASGAGSGSKDADGTPDAKGKKSKKDKKGKKGKKKVVDSDNSDAGGGTLEDGSDSSYGGRGKKGKKGGKKESGSKEQSGKKSSKDGLVNLGAVPDGAELPQGSGISSTVDRLILEHLEERSGEGADVGGPSASETVGQPQALALPPRPNAPANLRVGFILLQNLQTNPDDYETGALHVQGPGPGAVPNPPNYQFCRWQLKIPLHALQAHYPRGWGLRSPKFFLSAGGSADGDIGENEEIGPFQLEFFPNGSSACRKGEGFSSVALHAPRVASSIGCCSFFAPDLPLLCKRRAQWGNACEDLEGKAQARAAKKAKAIGSAPAAGHYLDPDVQDEIREMRTAYRNAFFGGAPAPHAGDTSSGSGPSELERCLGPADYGSTSGFKNSGGRNKLFVSREREYKMDSAGTDLATTLGVSSAKASSSNRLLASCDEFCTAASTVHPVTGAVSLGLVFRRVAAEVKAERLKGLAEDLDVKRLVFGTGGP